MRRYEPTEPLLYLHLPRCAGRSLAILLARWFGEGYRWLAESTAESTWESTVGTVSVSPRPINDPSQTGLAEIACIHGQFNHAAGRGLPFAFPQIRQYVTILRDPFDLVVSNYFFAKEHAQLNSLTPGGNFPARRNQLASRAPFPTLQEYLGRYPHWFFEHLPLDLDLANFEEQLAERFVYIGVFEDLENSIRGMARALNKQPIAVPKLNATTYREPVPPEFRSQFYRQYPLLKKIHNFAVEHYRFDRLERKIPF